MKHAALLLPILLATPGDSIQYQAEQGSRVRITTEHNAEISLVDQEFTVTVDGEEQPTGEQPDVEVTLSLSQSVVFVDSIQEAKEGQPTKIERSFETLNGVFSQEITGLPEGMDAPEPVEVGSELEGESIILSWDEEESEWIAEASEDASYSEEALEPIEHNADLSYLLTDEEIEAGSSWELDAEAFRRLMDLSGEIDMKPDDKEEEEEEEGEETWEAKTFVLTVKEFDDSSATITVELQAGRVEESEMEMEIPDHDMDPPVITMEDTLEWDLTGELIWNRKANRADSMTLEGTLSRHVDRQQEMSGPMGDVSIHEIQSFEGPFSVTMTFEDAPEGE